MNSSSFEQGEIVVVPIPFSSQFSAKIRPALVISKKEYNNKSEDVIVLKITSKGKNYPFDIELREKDLSSGKLKHESVIQADFPVVVKKKSASQKNWKNLKSKTERSKTKTQGII